MQNIQLKVDDFWGFGCVGTRPPNAAYLLKEKKEAVCMAVEISINDFYDFNDFYQ